jgi:SNF2 family DNA or RNA helicase
VGVLAGIVGRLAAAGFTPMLDEASQQALEARNATLRVDLGAADTRMDAIDAKLAGRGLSLYGFQRTGVRWLVSRSSALLSDEMGLGKTIQALASLPEDIGVVVVCPASVKGSWAREIATWRPEFKVTLLEGRDSFRWPAQGEIVITNYEVLPLAAQIAPMGSRYKEPKFARQAVDARGEKILVEDDALKKARPAFPVRLILDEAHFAKNSRAKRTIACRALSDLCEGTLVLTATPLIKSPPELYSVLQLGGLARESFGSYAVFKQLMGGVDERVARDTVATVWKGVTDPTEVGQRLSRVMMRRLRAEVLPDLPVKTYQEIPVDISAKAAKLAEKLAEEASTAGINIYEIQDIGELPFEMFSEVRKALAEAKIDALVELVERYEEEGEPLVVFSAHVAPLDALGKREGWAVIHGGTPQRERTAIIEAFQAGQLKGVACGIKSAGVGITLTRAAHMVFVDRAWNPGDNAQAEDRCARIGQTRGVQVMRLVAKHALDKHIAYLIDKKTALVEASVEMGRVIDKQVETLDVSVMVAQAAEENARVEAEAARVAAAASAAGGKVSRKGTILRPARSTTERWAQAGLQALLLACDGVVTEDGVGFSRVTRGVGASLAKQLLAVGMLSDKQWSSAIGICRIHHAQVGMPDGEV